ncbi:hypothetical protein [Ectopseudomonas toyotomiensis]|nr:MULTISPECIES: hypothetical protein [Pseudomonas]
MDRRDQQRSAAVQRICAEMRVPLLKQGMLQYLVMTLAHLHSGE